jgi:hypothetical protein
MVVPYKTGFVALALGQRRVFSDLVSATVWASRLIGHRPLVLSRVQG